MPKTLAQTNRFDETPRMLNSIRSSASAVVWALISSAAASLATSATAQDDAAPGPVLSACLNRADTNVQMQACAAAEYRRQDDRLNTQYRRAQARLSAAQFATLRQEQRAWLRDRGSKCRGGGTNAALSITLCRATETEDRANYLATYRAPGRPAPASLHSWMGRWQGPEGLFLDVRQGRVPNEVNLIVKDNLDDRNSYVGRFSGSTIEFERRGRTETIRRGVGSQTGFSFLRARRDCLIVVANREGYCRPD